MTTDTQFPKTWFTIDEAAYNAAAILDRSVSPDEVRNWYDTRKKGPRLETLRVGRRVIIPKSALFKWAQAMRGGK